MPTAPITEPQLYLAPMYDDALPARTVTPMPYVGTSRESKEIQSFGVQDALNRAGFRRAIAR